MKYRIIARQVYVILNLAWRLGDDSEYAVQVKYNFLPFWIRVTKWFETKSQAEEYIQLIKDIK